MKRIFALTLAILFTIFTLPVNGLTVLAEKEIKTYKDGTYTVPLNFLHEKNNEDSTMQNFSKDGSASVIIKNGKALVRTTFTSAEMIGSLKVDNKDAEVFSENKVADERTYSFNVENLDAIINGEISVNAGIYSKTHKIRLKFDVAQIPLVENTKEDESDGSNQDDSSTEDSAEGDHLESEDPAKGDKIETESTAKGDNSESEDSDEGDNLESEDPAKDNNSETEDPAEGDKIETETTAKGDNSKTEGLAKGETLETDETKDIDKATLTPDRAYEVNYQIKDEKDKEVSSADSFFVKPGSLLEKEGILYAQLTINQGDLIQNLSTKKYGDVLIVKENKDGSIVVQFRIDNNLSNILLNMQIVVPNMPEYAGKHNALLKFDKKSKKEIKASEFKLVASNTENGPNPIAGEPEAKPISEDKKQKKQKQTTEVNGKKVDESITKKSYDTKKLVPNKAYTINYTIKHEDGVKTSMADEFFKKPGKLLEKDGVLYAQFTITNGNMVKQLSTEFGDALIVKKNKDGSIVVQFKVNKDLSNMKLSMIIDVPGLYTEKHEAILVFDKNSKKEIDASKEKLVASSSENGPTVKGGIEGKGLGNGGSKDNKDALTNLSNGGPDKPEFGSNGNGGLNDKGKSTNPQTGDLTNIWLYAFLLAASLLILGVKFRRRTI